MCPLGKAMKATPEKVKTKVCLADDRYVEAQCYGCMKKAFSRAFPIYPECLNCNYTNGTEVFCPDVGMGYADCGIAGSTTCEVPKNKVTEKANCPKKTEAEAYSWCPDIMGDPTCSDANPTDSFQCDEGQPVASSTFGWAKCPRKATPQEKDPECSGCLSQHKNAYVRKVEGCYQCFKDGTTNKAGQALKWCSDAGMGEQGCGFAASTFCETGASFRGHKPLHMPKRHV